MKGFVAQAFLPVWFCSRKVVRTTQARMPVPQRPKTGVMRAFGFAAMRNCVGAGFNERNG